METKIINKNTKLGELVEEWVVEIGGISYENQKEIGLVVYTGRTRFGVSLIAIRTSKNQISIKSYFRVPQVPSYKEVIVEGNDCFSYLGGKRNYNEHDKRLVNVGL